MTVSTHVYSARVMPGNKPLGAVAGSITLDSAGFPHVTGDVSFSMPDAAQLALLDPRQSARVEVTATRDGGTPRVFDLGIREVTPDRAAGTVRVSLASDEALLSDFSRLADDRTPRTHETSLRAVCNYVLGKIGAALQADTTDANVTAYWAVTNLVTNSSIEVNTDGWTAGTNASALSREPVSYLSSWGLRWATGAAGVSYADYAAGSGVRVTAGRWYVLSGYMISAVASTCHARVHFKNDQGVTIAMVNGAAAAVDGSGWSRPYVIVQAPPGATSVSVHFGFQATAGGQNSYVDAVMFYEGNELIPYYDGSTPDDARYDYSWSAAAHASSATRTPVLERTPESLIWRAGVSAMEFLHPLIKAAGLRLVCDEQRRWTLRDAAFVADGVQTYRYAANIEAATEKLSRASEDWFDAAVYEYIWTDRDGIEQRRIDAFALTATPTKTTRREVRTPYPGPGAAENIVRRAQGRGRAVTVTAVPMWTERADQLLSILLDGTPIQTGLAASVEWSLDDDTVTVTARTTDTPAAAWILIPQGQQWKSAPAGATWKNEVI